MSFKTAIKNKLIEGAALAADAKIDGREIGRTLLNQIAGQTNDVSKRKIARGPLSNLILEVVEGLWENDLEALAKELAGRASLISAGARQAANPASAESNKSTNVSPGNTSTR